MPSVSASPLRRSATASSRSASSASASPQGRTASGPSTPSSFTPTSRARSSQSDQPRAHTPYADRGAARSTAGRTRIVAPVSSVASSRSSAPSMPLAHSGAMARSVKPRLRHHRLLTASIILVAALALALFGAWNWVDSNLNSSQWLPGTPNTPGTSWLILGSDERDGTTGQDGTTGARTDTILVLTKPNSGPSSLISIPRDSLVQVGQDYMKINAVYQISKTDLVKQVETVTGQHIDHVAEIQFGGLKSVVDALGGVKLCYDHTVDDVNSGMKWQAGCHVANGDQALAFSRMRYSDPNGDFGRAARQRQVIAAIMSTAASGSTLSNFGKTTATAKAGLRAIRVDEHTTPYTLATMAMAFRSAAGGSGVTGSLYWKDAGYYVDGVGSCVLLDTAKNHELFAALGRGEHKSGTVGTLAEANQQQ